MRSIFARTNYSVANGVIVSFFSVIVTFYCGLVTLDIVHMYIDSDKLMDSDSINNIFECDTASIQLSNLTYVKIAFTAGELLISWVLLRLLVKRLVILHISKETSDFLISRLKRDRRNNANKQVRKPSTFKGNNTINKP